ncbi:MAG: hypothetical protein OXG24_07100 [Gammaproteobacteria bacterium]|nr:hypothetical protein [Gammaproteobacteria bacterium]
MNHLLHVMVIASCLAVAINVNGVPCPKSPGFRLSEEATQKCEVQIDESLDDCQVYVNHLKSVVDPTAQQRFDLAFGLSKLRRLESVLQGRESIKQEVVKELRKLHEEFPNDVQVLMKLAWFEDYWTEFRLERRIAELAPDCTKNSRSLVEKLDRQTGQGMNRAGQDPILVQELAAMTDLGFKHSERNWDKMLFGHLRYREYLLSGERKQAAKFRDEAIAELDPENFPFVEDPNNHGWSLLCGPIGYDFRFSEFCLNSIERVLSVTSRPRDYDVDRAYRGARLLAHVLVDPPSDNPTAPKIPSDPSELVGTTTTIVNSDGTLEDMVVDEASAEALFEFYYSHLHGPPKSHLVSFKPYKVTEATKFIIRLRDILESVPEDQRTKSFCEAYKYVLGEERRKEVDEMYCN